MTRTAAKVDASQASIVSALRAIGCIVIDTHDKGQGYPDLNVITPDGHVLLVECKTPGNVRFTEAEMEFIFKLVHPAYRVFTTPEQAIETIRKMEG